MFSISDLFENNLKVDPYLQSQCIMESWEITEPNLLHFISFYLFNRSYTELSRCPVLGKGLEKQTKKHA